MGRRAASAAMVCEVWCGRSPDGTLPMVRTSGDRSAAHRTLRRMDPSLRAALSRGWEEEAGVPGEAAAEAGLSAARRDRQRLEPAAMGAAMGRGRAGGMAGGGAEGAEGSASAARRGKRLFDENLFATLERGLALQAAPGLARLTLATLTAGPHDKRASVARPLQRALGPPCSPAPCSPAALHPATLHPAARPAAALHPRPAPSQEADELAGAAEEVLVAGARREARQRHLDTSLLRFTYLRLYL